MDLQRPLPISGKKIVLSPTYVEEFDVLLSHNDVLAFLRTVPSDVAQLIISSPPYNIGKPYEQRVKLDQYLGWQYEVLKECVRILKDPGSLCWEVGNYIDSGEVYPLDTFFYHLIKERLGLKLRNRIIWSFGHGLHASRRFSGRYEVIQWFTKGDAYLFNLDVVRVPQKYPGKRYYKGPNKGKPSAHPLGKNPGDVWTILIEDWDCLIWDVPNVKSNHPEKTIHPSQFPIELIERLVLALTNPGDVILDPFMGVGSALIASILHDRRAMGVDKEKVYVDIAYERTIQAVNGVLRRRPLGKPKYQPTGKEKVSQIPPEWH